MTRTQTLSGPIEDRSLIDLVGTDVIVRVVRRNLHVSLRKDDTTAENQDALDLVGDIQVALLSALENNSTNGRPIENVDAYAATVATNACYQYFRAKFPIRAQQMNKLRYLLTHDWRFEMFKADETWHCKLAGREGAATRPSGNKERENYATAVAMLLQERGTITLDELVTEVMATLGLAERKPLDADDPFDRVAAVESPADRRLETHDRLQRLWKGVLGLPLNHRKALLLNLRDGGGGLIWALPASGVAGVDEIAATLGMSPDAFSEIWETLPWDDLKIAEHLGLERQQVINLRQSARAKLMRYEDDRK